MTCNRPAILLALLVTTVCQTTSLGSAREVGRVMPTSTVIGPETVKEKSPEDPGMQNKPGNLCDIDDVDSHSRNFALEALEPRQLLSATATNSSPTLLDANTLHLVYKPATAPTLSASLASNTSIQLVWSDLYDNETGFRIDRRLGISKTWTTLATLDADTTGYTDAGLQPGISYSYQVFAMLNGGLSAPSTKATVTTPAVPAAAGKLAATVLSSSQIQLTWADNSTDETGFKIERSADGVNFTLVSTAAPNITSFTDTNLSPTTNYSYLILATNTQGDAAPSNMIAATTAALLLPGTGFTGPTPQPPAEGTADQQGYDEMAIARWDVVPYQTFDKTMNVGVVAFDIASIDRVEFSVNGGRPVPVKSMTLNPETGVVEYWATLDASKFTADGAIEVRAVAYPKVGVPRVLAGPIDGSTTDTSGNYSIFLYTNAHGLGRAPAPIYVDGTAGNDTVGTGSASAPYQTLTKAADTAQSGGTIIVASAGRYHLDQGARYAFRKMNDHWITIRAADGLLPSDVVVDINTRPRIGMLHWVGITFDTSHGGQYYNDSDEYTWWDHVIYTDFNGFDDNQLVYNPIRTSARTYVSDSQFHDCVYGPANFDLVRNTTSSHIGGDVWQNSRIVINSTVDRVGGRTDGWHADVLQLFGNPDNNIYYNLTATNVVNGQGIFTDKTGVTEGVGYRNIAYVNFNLKVVPGITNLDIGHMQFSSWNTNVLFRNVTSDGRLIFRGPSSISTEEFRGQDVLFEDCKFAGINPTVIQLPTGVTAR